MDVNRWRIQGTAGTIPYMKPWPLLSATFIHSVRILRELHIGNGIICLYINHLSCTLHDMASLTWQQSSSAAPEHSILMAMASLMRSWNSRAQVAFPMACSCDGLTSTARNTVAITSTDISNSGSNELLAQSCVFYIAMWLVLSSYILFQEMTCLR